MTRTKSTSAENMFDRRQRRGGVQRDAGFFALRFDQMQGAVQMRPGFGMNGDDVGPGLGESGDEMVSRRDHQMNVENLCCCAGAGL